GLLLARRLRVVRMDLRGCGRGIALARRGYHAGCSEDVRAALTEIQRWTPTSPVTLVGISLGGNIGLKLAGEATDRPVPGPERGVSSLPLLPRIAVPTLILTARDDPFVAAEPFEAVTVPQHINICIVPQGGHIGFLGPDGAGGIRWAERRIAEWVTRPDASCF